MDEGILYLVLAVMIIAAIIAAIMAIIYVGLIVLAVIAAAGAISGFFVAAKNFFEVLTEAHTAVPGAPGSARQRQKAVVAIVVVTILLMATAGLAGYLLQARGSSNLTRDDKTPPTPSTEPLATTTVGPPEIVDRGVCPFEGCRYGEQWMAKTDVDVYAAPPESVGASVSSLQKRAVVQQGHWVVTQTGVVLAKRHEGRVDPELLRSGSHVVNGQALREGQVFSIYSYLGEGCWRTWIDGHLVNVCDVALQGKAQQEWWIQIKTADGLDGWTNAASSFVSQQGLNNELGEKIADPKLPLADKLAQIDALLKGGARLDGGAGQYGIDPMEAAISTGDTELIQTLISKGLNLRTTQPCPAFWASQKSLREGGDVVLAFLLENGMRLDCLSEPPLHSFLRFGISAADYPVERAIAVAEILVKNGADVNQRDPQGKSVFDVVGLGVQANGASRMAPLTEALSRLAR
jgi:hypothetical protein